MSKEKRSVPKLRFPGFTEDWEQRKVNEIFKVTRGQVLAASLTTPEKNRENIYPVYSSQTKDNGLLGYYSEYLFENAITWTTDGANAGTVNFRPGRFYSTNVNGVLINENGYACYAVSEIINKVAYKYVSKVGNPKLMNNVMAEINIMITPDIDELEQISKLIEAYNQYITLHQRKLEHLNLKKKALLQKLFPKNGERYPELRFPGFTDAWEQRKLGDIATFSKGNGYSKSDLTPSGDPIILYGRLYTNYETTISNVDTFVGLKDKSVISQGGEVIVPASGETAEDISRASVVKNQGIIIGGDLNVIKVNHLLDPTFLALTISNGGQQKELSKRAQGKSVVHLHNSDLQEVNLTFPLLNEQKEISTLFEKMDNIITLHQQEPFLCGNSVNGGVELC